MQQRPGLAAAARALGVTWSHLYRVVVTKERASASLLKRYHEYERSQKPVLQVPPEIAAAENLTPYFFATLARLGLQVVAVRLQAGPSSPALNHPEIERELEQELRAAGVGQFDSDFYDGGARWFFYHIRAADLGNAMRILKDGLASRGLQSTAALLHVETPSELRVWWPDDLAAKPVDARLEEEPPA